MWLQTSFYLELHSSSDSVLYRVSYNALHYHTILHSPTLSCSLLCRIADCPTLPPHCPAVFSVFSVVSQIVVHCSAVFRVVSQIVLHHLTLSSSLLTVGYVSCHRWQSQRRGWVQWRRWWSVSRWPTFSSLPRQPRMSSSHSCLQLFATRGELYRPT